jgi:hypothetical protein
VISVASSPRTRIAVVARSRSPILTNGPRLAAVDDGRERDQSELRPLSEVRHLDAVIDDAGVDVERLDEHRFGSTVGAGADQHHPLVGEEHRRRDDRPGSAQRDALAITVSGEVSERIVHSGARRR